MNGKENKNCEKTKSQYSPLLFQSKIFFTVFLYFLVKNLSIWIFSLLLSFISNRWNYTFLPKDEDPKVFFYLFWELINSFYFHHMNQKHKTTFLEFALYFCNKIVAYLFNQKFSLPLLFGENLNIWISPFLLSFRSNPWNFTFLPYG